MSAIVCIPIKAGPLQMKGGGGDSSSGSESSLTEWVLCIFVVAAFTVPLVCCPQYSFTLRTLNFWLSCWTLGRKQLEIRCLVWSGRRQLYSFYCCSSQGCWDGEEMFLCVYWSVLGSGKQSNWKHFGNRTNMDVCQAYVPCFSGMCVCSFYHADSGSVLWDIRKHVPLCLSGSTIAEKKGFHLALSTCCSEASRIHTGYWPSIAVMEILLYICSTACFP